MKTASAPLLALLNGTNLFIFADCYQVTLYDGTIYRWTTADYPMTVDGDVYSTRPNAPVLSRGTVREGVGLQVNSLPVTLGVGDSGFTIGGVPLAAAARNGLFDGAAVRVKRVFMSTPTTANVTTSLIRFSGIVSTVAPTPTAVTLTVKSELAKLERQMPRNVVQPGCAHVLYDAGCALVKASFTVTGVVGAAATVTAIPTNLTQANAYFEQGVIVFTSGVNLGARRSVKTYVNASGVVTPTIALPVAPANGDTFSIFPGCDKSQATCLAKFANLVHFRGFPYVPKPESAR